MKSLTKLFAAVLLSAATAAAATTHYQKASSYSGVDICSQISQAVAALPTDGGYVDASDITGPQTCTTQFWSSVQKHIIVYLNSQITEDVDDTIPSSVSLWMAPDASIAPATHYQLRILGPIVQAPPPNLAVVAWPSAVIDQGGQVFNVKAYGAKGDGSTDDTTAIQSALNAAAAVHGIALVPTSTANYKIASFLTMPGSVTLQGASGISGSSTLEFSSTTPGACTDAQASPISTGFIRFSGGDNRITGLGLKVDSAAAASCLINMQDGNETSYVEIDHNIMLGASSTTDTNVGIYLYSVDSVSIHDNIVKDWGQPIHGGAHTWASVNIGPHNIISTGANHALPMLLTPTGANCFQSKIYLNVFEGYQSTNGINSTCTNGMIIEGNYFGDASPTGGDWIVGSAATLIGNYIDGSGLLSSGGHAINGSFNVAIGNYIYGKSLFTTGGTLTGNTFLSGPSAGCFVTMNQSAVVVSTANSFTTSGGAANSYCHANSLTPHPIVISNRDTDSTTSGIQSGVTVKYDGKTSGTASALPVCSADTEGNSIPVTDATLNTFGSTVAGGGTNHVNAYCDGTNWTVAAQ